MFSVEYIIGCLIGAVLTITVHEFSKAAISSALGDPLPKRDGRLTPNPLKHIEPIGFLVMVGLGFGWGKPVETAAIYYKDRRTGTLITYIMPSVLNLLFGIMLAFIWALFDFAPIVRNIFYMSALLNMRHALFNIIPVYPLDGAKVLAALRDPNRVITMINNQMFYQIALMIFIGWGIVGRIIDPFCLFIMYSLSGIYAGF